MITNIFALKCEPCGNLSKTLQEIYNQTNELKNQKHNFVKLNREIKNEKLVDIFNFQILK